MMLYKYTLELGTGCTMHRGVVHKKVRAKQISQKGDTEAESLRVSKHSQVMGGDEHAGKEEGINAGMKWQVVGGERVTRAKDVRCRMSRREEKGQER